MARTIVIGGFWHESDTFNPIEAESSSFEWAEGDALFSWLGRHGKESELFGVADELEKRGYALAPTLAVSAPVAGSVPQGIFQKYMQTLKRQLQVVERGQVDGVIFSLHGSTTVTGHQDAQREIVNTLREFFDSPTPLVVTFDLHASPSPELQRLVDGIVAYHTAPHRDVVDTGRRAARLMLELLSTPKPSHIISFRIPMLLPGEFGQTDHEPTKHIMSQIQSLVHDTEEVLDASFLQGYPWADSPHAMTSLVVVSSETTASLLDHVETLARSIFAVRERFYQSAPVLSITEALARARDKSRESLLYLCDSGDNPTAGAVEDRIDFLAEALKTGTTGLVFAPIVAPKTVAETMSQVGSEVMTGLGGQLVDQGLRVNVQAKVLHHFHDDLGGDVVLLDISGNLVIATTKRVPMHGPDWIRRFKIDPEDPSRVFVLKSGYLFPAFEDMLQAIPGAASYLVATKGASSLDLNTFTYHLLARPIYPLDQSGPWRLDRMVTSDGHIQQMGPIIL